MLRILPYNVNCKFIFIIFLDLSSSTDLAFTTTKCVLQLNLITECSQSVTITLMLAKPVKMDLTGSSEIPGDPNGEIKDISGLLKIRKTPVVSRQLLLTQSLLHKFQFLEYNKFFLIQSLNLVFSHTAMISKSGNILNCFAFASSSPYCDMWLSYLLRATTPHRPRFSKSTRYI